MTLLEKFGDFIESHNNTKFDALLIHHARRALLDWQAALLAGSNTQAANRLRAAFSDELSSTGLCSIAGVAPRASARTAAFVNGSISHIAEFDDIYRDGAYHTGCPTISAVFSLAQSKHSSLDELLRAIIIGYEVSNRISRVIQPSHYVYFHTTGTVGVFGASAACAALLKLNSIQACNAMAIAGTFASGLQEAFRSDSMTKPMHAGHAAEVGLSAALAANAGMTGANNLLEGEAGFGAAMSKAPRWNELFEYLGEDFSISKMTFKNHGCCGHTFPAIDGVGYLIQAHNIQATNIKRIRIGAYRPTVEVCAYRHPKTPFEAKFSLSYTVAARIILGRVREKAFLPIHFLNQDIFTLEEKVELYIDQECADRFPKRRSAKIEIELNDGSIFKHYQLTRHGDPDDPLSDQELMDKFFELVEPRIGTAMTEELAQLIMSAENIKIEEITNLWRGD
jgi:2-methylcitrate dehydratase PrpD